MTNTKTQKITVGIIIALIIAIAMGLVYTSYKEKEEKKTMALSLLQQQEQQAILEKQKSESEAIQNELVAKKELEDMLKEKANKPNPSTPESKPQDELKPTDNVTVDKDGNVTVDKEYTKPTPPPPPKTDGSTGNPNSKPEYKPEDTNKPPVNTEPKYGTKNDKGEIYMGKDWGWVMPSKTETIVSDKGGTGEIIGH